MDFEADFEGEFNSIRRMSPEEAENDRLFQKLRSKRRNEPEVEDGPKDEVEVITIDEVSRRDLNQSHIDHPKRSDEEIAARKRKKYSKIMHIPLTDPLRFKGVGPKVDEDLDVILVDDLEPKEAEDFSVVGDVADTSEGLKVPEEHTPTDVLDSRKEESEADRTSSESPIVIGESNVVEDYQEILESSLDAPTIDTVSKTISKVVETASEKISESLESISENISAVVEYISENITEAVDDPFVTTSKESPDPLIANRYTQSKSASITDLRKTILSQLQGKFNNLKQSAILGERYNEIYKLFEHTVRDHEGHSTLIIGPRASGKTACIETALSDLKLRYDGQFLTIRLNALIHSDDNVALREIAKQLDVNRILEDQDPDDSDLEEAATFEQRSINDTFANILATLQQKADGISIIFIIDEFEKFTTNNNKQTLLYNLFDLTQDSGTPVCVVGVSTKLTVRESLEKRVKSRFSQRIILISKVKLIEDFWHEAKLNLTTSDVTSYSQEWNFHIDKLFSTPQSNLRKLVYQNYFSIKNFKELNNSMVYAISKVNKDQPFPLDSDFSVYQNLQMVNNAQGIVASLSPLELLLTIAAARWIDKFELQVINFNLAYGEYKDMIKNYNISSTGGNSSSSGLDAKMLTNIKINQKLWSPDILKNSWEFLYKLGLLLDALGFTTNNDGHIITNTNLNKNLVIEDNRMVQLDVTLDELGNLLEENHVFKKMTSL